SWTQARPPWSSANRATSDRPMPTPGAWAAAPGPRRNGPQQGTRSSRGFPPPPLPLGRAPPAPHRLGPPLERAPAALPPLGGDPAHERGHVGPAAPRRHQPLAEPVHVQQGGEEAVELAGGGHP